MIRLVITVLTGFATISMTSTFDNCSESNYVLCGNTCTSFDKICYCGDKSFIVPGHINDDFVCVSDSDCILESDGKLIIVPFLNQKQVINIFQRKCQM